MRVAILILFAGMAAAIPIRGIRVHGNHRTQTSTVLRVARISVGDRYTEKAVDHAKSDLVDSGLFSAVEIDTRRRAEGVDVDIFVKERWTWYIVPSAAFWSGNKGGSLLYAQTNFRGQNERLFLYGGLFTADSQLAAVYQDPAILDTHYYGRLDASLSRSKVNEFNPDLANGGNLSSPELFRVSPLWSGGAGIQFGRELTRELHLDLYYHFAVLRYESPCVTDSCSNDGISQSSPLQTLPGASRDPPAPDGNVAYLHLVLEYNSMVNLWGVRCGMVVGGWIEGAHRYLGSDEETLKGVLRVATGLRFFHEHNLVLSASVGAGLELPFDFEFEGGGPGLRGFPFRQFRGDTLGEAHAEYVAPLFKVWKIEVRGTVFYDSMALWFRSLEGNFIPGGSYQVRHADGTFRNFLPAVDASGMVHPPSSGFDLDHWHNSVGAGIRFYLRSINLPLLGVDVGYGIEAREFHVLLGLGALVPH